MLTVLPAELQVVAIASAIGRIHISQQLCIKDKWSALVLWPTVRDNLKLSRVNKRRRTS